MFCDVVTKHRGNAPDTGQTFEGRGIMNRNQAARLRVIVKFYTAAMDAGDGAIIEGGGRDCHDMLLKLNSRIAGAACAFFEKQRLRVEGGSGRPASTADDGFECAAILFNVAHYVLSYKAPSIYRKYHDARWYEAGGPGG